MHVRVSIGVKAFTHKKTARKERFFLTLLAMRSRALKLSVLDDIDQNAINWWEAAELCLCLGGRFVGTSVFGFLYGEVLCNTCIL